MRVGPCSAWVDQAAIEAVGSTPSDITADRWVELADAATAILFRLSGSQYAGECTTTVRPSRSPIVDPPPHAGSGWVRIGGSCSSGCGTVAAVTLGVSPVTEIIEVVIDGETLDPSAYRVDGARELVRQDGQGWPCHQDLNLPLGEVGTWSVELAYGTLPDAAGLLACAEFARQLGLSVTQDDKCKLPKRVQTITRQGVSMTILDPQDFLDQGRTGIYLVDVWLKAVNPAGLRRRARVSSPDVMAPARTVDV